MFIISNFLMALALVLGWIFTIAYWLILIRALISWVNPDPYNPIVQFLYKTTEPILYPIRKLLSRLFSSNFNIGIDISPIIAFLLIFFLREFLIKSLYDIAMALR